MKYLIYLCTLFTCFSNYAQPPITINDSICEHSFAQIPKRVIALRWPLAENLLELGITPLAIADPDDYKTWVVTPQLPDEVINAGTRQAPNIELIAKLKPDVILVGDEQAHLIDKLNSIAPVLYFQGFDKNHNNVATSKQIFMTLASLFGKTAQAEQRIKQMYTRIAELNLQLDQHFTKNRPPATAIRFQSKAVALVFGDNSMPQYALHQLGFNNALAQPTSRWGVAQQKIIQLGKIKQGIVIYFKPFTAQNSLFNSPLWQAMPFVQTGHFAAAASTWSNGGYISIEYLAQSLTDALLMVEP